MSQVFVTVEYQTPAYVDNYHTEIIPSGELDLIEDRAIILERVREIKAEFESVWFVERIFVSELIDG